MVDVVKVNAHSEGREVYIVNTGLEFSRSDFSVLLNWLPDEVCVILYNLWHQLLAKAVVKNLDEFVFFNCKTYDLLMRLVDEL